MSDIAKSMPVRAALVTGGGQRIGSALVRALSNAGWAVAIHCNKSTDAAKALAATLAGRTCVVTGDLSDAETPARLVAEATDALGPLNLLVNNAAIFEDDSIQTLEIDQWDHQLAVNLRAPVFLAQALAKQLPTECEGNIINMIDQRVLKLNPLFFSYTVAKTALWTVTRTLAQALAPHIRVNGIGPGPTLPNKHMGPGDFDREAAATLLGHGTSPEEIAQTVLFILSQPAFTGQLIALDGGQHLNWHTPDMTGLRKPHESRGYP